MDLTGLKRDKMIDGDGFAPWCNEVCLVDGRSVFRLTLTNFKGCSV